MFEIYLRTKSACMYIFSIASTTLKVILYIMYENLLIAVDLFEEWYNVWKWYRLTWSHWDSKEWHSCGSLVSDQTRDGTSSLSLWDVRLRFLEYTRLSAKRMACLPSFPETRYQLRRGVPGRLHCLRAAIVISILNQLLIT